MLAELKRRWDPAEILNPDIFPGCAFENSVLKQQKVEKR